MKEVVGIEKIKKLLPYLALLTIFAYMSAITLQLGYFNAFGLDLFILTPRIDPTSLVGIVIPILMGLLGLLEVLFLRKAAKTSSLILPIVGDVLIGGILIGSGIMYTLNPDNLHERAGPIGPYVQYLLFLFVIVMTLKRVHDMRHYAKGGFLKRKKSMKEAYIETWFLKSKKKTKRKGSLGEIFTVGAIVLVIATAALPYAVGDTIARNRSAFSELSEPTPEKGFKFVVIGQSADGYIVKNYNMDKNTYESGWNLYKEDTLKFKPTSIKSLSELEK